MGTRNLTAVYIDGSYKVAQYGQWDGYPEGQGMNILQFLRDKMDEGTFKKALRNSTFIKPEVLTTLWRSYGVDEQGIVSMENADKMRRDHPEYSRDTGSNILELIQNHPEGMRLQDNITFAADSFFCEWAWVIDFDAGTFEAYGGFNTAHELTPEERFYFLKEYEDDGYHGVILLQKWPLSALPTEEEFLDAFKEGKEVEEE